MTPFYKKALGLFTKTQANQIQKGLEKYPEPFNPHNWTPDQLLNHALEESVDLVHYLVGLKEQLDKQEDYIKQLEQELRYLKSENIRLSESKVSEELELYRKHYPNAFERFPTPPYFDADDQ